MNEKQDNKILTIIVILVLILVTAQSIYNITEASRSSSKEKAKSSAKLTIESDNLFSGKAGYTDPSIASASICLNVPPIISYDCNLTNASLSTNLTYNCTFIALDPNGDQMSFTTSWFTTPSMFEVQQDGRIDFNPKKTNIGQINQVRVNISDNSNCTNYYTYKDYNISVYGGNRPPYLYKNIDNEKLTQGHSVYFYLSDHFRDPDDDELSYFFMILSGNSVEIKLAGSNTEVKGTGCGNTTVYYVAMDPLGLTASSNFVNYEVQCLTISPQSSDNNQNSQGSGGSGSGSTRDCKPQWKCNVWSQCRMDNRSYRRCIDYNACTLQYIQYFTQNCTYLGAAPCHENWDCSEWGRCINGTHTRMCLDLQNCITSNNKPADSENCSIIASCFNGIQDQGETEIDCGGPCGACRRIEQPTPINQPMPVALIILGILVGTGGILVAVFHKKIMDFFDKLSSKKHKFKRKVYINNKQKDKLVQSVNIMQARLDEHKVDHALDESSILVREYFKQLLTIENLDKQELINKIVKLKDKELEKLLVMFYAKILNTIHMRNKGIEIRESEVQALIDEISHEIYLIAEFTDQDAISSVKDRTTESKIPIDVIYNKLSNIYIALKFGELIAAKSIYKEILKEYDKLSTKDKSIPYTDIIRAFQAINYLEKQYKEQK